MQEIYDELIKNISKEEILCDSAKNIGTQTVTYLMGTGVNKLFAKAMNDPKIVNPKKGK